VEFGATAGGVTGKVTTTDGAVTTATTADGTATAADGTATTADGMASMAAAGIMVAECRAAAILVRERIAKSVSTDRSARFEGTG
jgi:hypothetical protein